MYLVSQQALSLCLSLLLIEVTDISINIGELLNKVGCVYMMFLFQNVEKLLTSTFFTHPVL